MFFRLVRFSLARRAEKNTGIYDVPASLVVKEVGRVAAGDGWKFAMNESVFQIAWSSHCYYDLVRN